MKRLHPIFVLVGLLAGTTAGWSQGFVNLNFENAVIVTNGQPQGDISASRALPGWTAYIGGTSQTSIIYNNLPLSAPEVCLINTNWQYTLGTYSGSYYVELCGEFNPGQSPPYTNSAAIGQTGQIPLSTQSLIYWGSIYGSGGLQVTFNGQLLNFSQIGSTANYAIYAADVSAYAGQTGLLLFTDPAYYYGNGGPATIDNIQFSSLPVPEPCGLPLAVLGTGLIGLLRWRRSPTRQ